MMHQTFQWLHHVVSPLSLVIPRPALQSVDASMDQLLAVADAERTS